VDPISVAVWLIVIIAAVAVVYWFLQYSGVVIPRPLQIVLMAVVAILCLIFLARLAGLWGPRAVVVV
jgi:hypothetical protein